MSTVLLKLVLGLLNSRVGVLFSRRVCNSSYRRDNEIDMGGPLVGGQSSTSSPDPRMHGEVVDICSAQCSVPTSSKFLPLLQQTSQEYLYCCVHILSRSFLLYF